MGCSLDSGPILSAVKQIDQSTVQLPSSVSDAGFASLDGADELASLGDGNTPEENSAASPLNSLAYPDRKDPFEFALEVDFDAPKTSDNRELKVVLFGFVGEAPVKAIVNVDGQTRVMQAGETWGSLEMIEIEPPRVRIRADGVVRSWSLLRQRDSTE
jgi:hypothetical protein